MNLIHSSLPFRWIAIVRINFFFALVRYWKISFTFQKIEHNLQLHTLSKIFHFFTFFFAQKLMVHEMTFLTLTSSLNCSCTIERWASNDRNIFLESCGINELVKKEKEESKKLCVDYRTNCDGVKISMPRLKHFINFQQSRYHDVVQRNNFWVKGEEKNCFF